MKFNFNIPKFVLILLCFTLNLSQIRADPYGNDDGDNKNEFNVNVLNNNQNQVNEPFSVTNGQQGPSQQVSQNSQNPLNLLRLLMSGSSNGFPRLPSNFLQFYRQIMRRYGQHFPYMYPRLNRVLQIMRTRLSTLVPNLASTFGVNSNVFNSPLSGARVSVMANLRTSGPTAGLRRLGSRLFGAGSLGSGGSGSQGAGGRAAGALRAGALGASALGAGALGLGALGTSPLLAGALSLGPLRASLRLSPLNSRFYNPSQYSQYDPRVNLGSPVVHPSLLPVQLGVGTGLASRVLIGNGPYRTGLFGREPGGVQRGFLPTLVNPYAAPGDEDYLTADRRPDVGRGGYLGTYLRKGALGVVVGDSLRGGRRKLLGSTFGSFISGPGSNVMLNGGLLGPYSSRGVLPTLAKFNGPVGYVARGANRMNNLVGNSVVYAARGGPLGTAYRVYNDVAKQNQLQNRARLPFFPRVSLGTGRSSSSSFGAGRLNGLYRVFGSGLGGAVRGFVAPSPLSGVARVIGNGVGGTLRGLVLPGPVNAAARVVGGGVGSGVRGLVLPGPVNAVARVVGGGVGSGVRGLVLPGPVNGAARAAGSSVGSAVRGLVLPRPFNGAARTAVSGLRGLVGFGRSGPLGALRRLLTSNRMTGVIRNLFFRGSNRNSRTFGGALGNAMTNLLFSQSSTGSANGGLLGGQSGGLFGRFVATSASSSSQGGQDVKSSGLFATGSTSGSLRGRQDNPLFRSGPLAVLVRGVGFGNLGQSSGLEAGFRQRLFYRLFPGLNFLRRFAQIRDSFRRQIFGNNPFLKALNEVLRRPLSASGLANLARRVTSPNSSVGGSLLQNLGPLRLLSRSSSLRQKPSVSLRFGVGIEEGSSNVSGKSSDSSSLNFNPLRSFTNNLNSNNGAY